MGIREGSVVVFLRNGRVHEGRVFALHDGAYSVEGTGARAYCVEHWEVIMVLGVDPEYLDWLLNPAPEAI
ncbi:MAG TPA: hypothetical protein VIO14_04920 [Dehalococcoidia bacterium]